LTTLGESKEDKMLEKKINDDLKGAMKEKKTIKIETLRMLKAEIKNVTISKKSTSLEDKDVFQIISKQIKQHRDSIETFSKGGREDLAEKEKQELEILQSYLPKQLSKEEVVSIVKQAIVETGAASRSDMGKVMKVVMEKVGGAAEGKLVSQIVAEQLGS